MKYKKSWFIKQINLANKYNLPIVVHMRDAAQRHLNCLKTIRLIKAESCTASPHQVKWH